VALAPLACALAAGVKRYLPSEFGCDLLQPRVRPMPVYKYKVAAEEQLKTLAAEGKITYTSVYNSSFQCSQEAGLVTAGRKPDGNAPT
jgi:hypothetical protein